jgi:Protein of unknown function (DUF3151)
MSGLPLYGVKETLLSPEPRSAVEGLAHALAGNVEGSAVVGERLRAVVAAHPTFLDGWAYLAEWALDDGDPVAAYAFARTGYHRGLDRIRKAGWGGQGPVPWRHEPNRGFLRSVHALMNAAALIGERDEAERCRDFLLQLDPDDALAVRDLGLG